MPEPEVVTLVWLTGTCCEGCSIKALGETGPDGTGGLEALATGRVEGLPRVNLVHPMLALESGEEFLEHMRRAARGELEPYGLVVEAAAARAGDDQARLFNWLGEEDGVTLGFDTWLHRLSAGAAFVIAFGDCAVWGGPHSLIPNPVRSTGTLASLGIDYRSTLGLPVINLPGCAPPPVLLSTLVTLLRTLQGETDGALELDAVNRPREAYQQVWKGAFVSWRG